MSEPFLFRVDFLLQEKSRITIVDDYDSSEFDLVDLRTPDRFPKLDKKYVFKLKGGNLDKLEKYDFYPYINSTLVVSDRMKKLIEKYCTGEVIFFKAEIISKQDEKLAAWIVAPLFIRDCVDFSKSVVRRWLVPGILPEDFDTIRFLPDCMGKHKIVRAEQLNSFILFSHELKEAVEELNSYGVKFIRDIEYEPYL